jgi:hypothetical protein
MAKNGHGVSSKTHTQTQRDHHANQKNPNNSAYRANQNNHANQCNPNNGAHKAAMNNHSNQCNPNHSTSKNNK